MNWLLLAAGVLAALAGAAALRRAAPRLEREAGASDEGEQHARRELAGLREQLAEGELSERDYSVLRDRLAAQVAGRLGTAAPPPAARSGLWLVGFAAATLAAVLLVVPALRERLPGMSSTGNNFIQPMASAPQPELTAQQFAALLRRAQRLDRAGRVREAIPIYRMAVAVLPRRADYRAQLGFALARAGRTEQALAQLRESVRLAPRFALGRLYLAAVLTRAGKRDEARAQARRFLELQPTGPGAAVGRKLLAQLR